MTEDRVLTLLCDARFIVSVPTRWCVVSVRPGESVDRAAVQWTGVLALTAGGRPCEPTDRAAAQWSAVGALERALLERGYTSELLDGCPARSFVLEAKQELLPNVHWREIDARLTKLERSFSHDDLVRWFDATIARRAGRAPKTTKGAA